MYDIQKDYNESRRYFFALYYSKVLGVNIVKEKSNNIFFVLLSISFFFFIINLIVITVLT